MPFHIQSLSEKKATLRKVVRERFQDHISCEYETLENQAAMKKCLGAAGGDPHTCEKVGSPENDTVMIVGAPCQAFSRLRTTMTAAEDHCSYNVLFENCVAMIKVASPLAVVIEQVEGFVNGKKKRCHLTEFLEQVDLETKRVYKFQAC